MSITHEVVNVQTTYPEDVPVYRPTYSQWEMVDQKEVKDGVEAVYQYVLGSTEAPGRVRIGCYRKNGKQSISIRFDTWVATTDTVTELTTYDEWAVTIAVQGPDGLVLTDGAEKAVQNAAFFGLMCPLATPALSTEPSQDTTLKNRLSHGIPTVDLSSMDDPATS